PSPTLHPHHIILHYPPFTSPAPATTSSDYRFTVATTDPEGEINEQNVERVIRQVLERLGK
ncbi:acetaldehyde dehydrogenase, partial [Escherichia coli]|nr:acetaldehyde dehydrogenase [Escherichia coli]